jgi:hypothetical protein
MRTQVEQITYCLFESPSLRAPPCATFRSSAATEATLPGFVLELEDGRTIIESGAIMLYLVEGSPMLPDDRCLRAEVVNWLAFEQADLLRAFGDDTARTSVVAGAAIIGEIRSCHRSTSPI